MKNTLLTLALALAASSAFAGPYGTPPPPPKNPVIPAEPPPPACNTISYDFVEAQYLRLFGTNEADGFGAHISKSITGNLFGFGSYNQFWGDTDFLSLDAGLGYHIPMTSCVDLVGKVACVYDESDFDEAFSGTVGLGFRIGLAQWLQLDLFYHGYAYEFEEYSNSGSAALIFREVIAPSVDVIVAGGLGEDDYQQVSAGFRYNF